jgi:hypothetical protein
LLLLLGFCPIVSTVGISARRAPWRRLFSRVAPGVEMALCRTPDVFEVFAGLLFERAAADRASLVID